MESERPDDQRGAATRPRRTSQARPLHQVYARIDCGANYSTLCAGPAGGCGRQSDPAHCPTGTPSSLGVRDRTVHPEVLPTAKGLSLPSRVHASESQGQEGKVLLWCPPGLDRDLYVAALDEAGFAATAVSTAAAAAHWLATAGTLDVVVMDLLPEPDEAWAFVRGCAPSGVAVIILTSFIRPDGANRQRARTMGCAAFVAKPCSLAQRANVVLRVRRGEHGLEITTYSEGGR